VPARRGFALRDAVDASQSHSGTYLGKALDNIRETYDRIIVITDEQAHDRVPGSRGLGYVVNVASAKNGVDYGAWAHIDGWSEAIVEYIRAAEQIRAHLSARTRTKRVFPEVCAKDDPRR
jgi:60 kDa SS-A/Ro ribonucleoprotein